MVINPITPSHSPQTSTSLVCLQPMVTLCSCSSKAASMGERGSIPLSRFLPGSLHEDEEGVPPTTLSEVSHIIILMDVKHGLNKEAKIILYLVFEYMEIDLKKFIRSFRQIGDIPPQAIKSLMYQLCKGVAFCYGSGDLHRDLKPHNLLMIVRR